MFLLFQAEYEVTPDEKRKNFGKQTHQQISHLTGFLNIILFFSPHFQSDNQNLILQLLQKMSLTCLNYKKKG